MKGGRVDAHIVADDWTIGRLIILQWILMKIVEQPHSVAKTDGHIAERDGCTELRGESRRFHATRSCTPPPQKELLSRSWELHMSAEWACKPCLRGSGILWTGRCLAWRIEGCGTAMGARNPHFIAACDLAC